MEQGLRVNLAVATEVGVGMITLPMVVQEEYLAAVAAERQLLEVQEELVGWAELAKLGFGRIR